jgi:fused signal recognition particle receptor
LLVVDGGTGGNAVVQACEFKSAIPLSGIIMTKLDGSGRGGALVGIKEATGLDPVFITTGETVDQMQPFNADQFVSELL